VSRILRWLRKKIERTFSEWIWEADGMCQQRRKSIVGFTQKRLKHQWTDWSAWKKPATSSFIGIEYARDVARRLQKRN
jgi:hypothetical protein